MATTVLLLARHGETDWNAVGRWQGRADPPLNDRGRAQAAELAATLSSEHLDAVVSSTLVRAAETADIVAARLGLAVTRDADLGEIDVGSWSGLTRAEVAERFPEGFARWEAGDIGHDGETREQLMSRVVAALHRVAAAHSEGRVLVVTHGGAIRAARRAATGEPGAHVENGSVVVLAVHDGTLVDGTGL